MLGADADDAGRARVARRARPRSRCRTASRRASMSAGSHEYLAGACAVPWLSARLAARRHACRRHGGRLPGPAGHGVRRGRRAAAGGRAAGPTLGPLAVYALLGSSRQLSIGPESTTALMTAVVADADRGRRSGPVRDVGGRRWPCWSAGSACWGAGPTRVPGRPAVQACPGRLHGRASP